MISIAVPAFKSVYLHNAIQSVLRQTYSDFELIIVNDASPEDIKAVVNQFDDSRIRYFENAENLGKESVVKNWNKCLEYARGEFFILFSDDDFYEPDFLAELVLLSEKYPSTHIFHSRVKQIDGNGLTITYTPLCPEWESGINFLWHRIKNYRFQYAPEFMCRTETLKKMGGFIDFPLAWCSDDATWFTIAMEGGIAYSAKPLCHWRSSGINISSVGAVSTRLKAICEFDSWLRMFIQHLTPISKDDADLLNEAQYTIPWKIGMLKSSILAKSVKPSMEGFMHLFFFWLRARNAYAISFKDFLKSVLWLFKRDRIGS